MRIKPPHAILVIALFFVGLQIRSPILSAANGRSCPSLPSPSSTKVAFATRLGWFEDEYPPLTKVQRDWFRAQIIWLKTVDPKSAYDDIMPLKKVIGDAPIVAIGEASHGTSESVKMKHRMISFLCREMDFRIVALEAPMPEAKRMNDYLITGKGDPQELLRRLSTQIYDTEEMFDLLTWMRRYNASGHGPIQFAGFDILSKDDAIENVLRGVAIAEPDYLGTVKEGYYGRDPLDEDPKVIATVKKRPDPKEMLGKATQIHSHIAAAKESYKGKLSCYDVDWLIQNALIVVQCIKESCSRDWRYREECMASNVEWILRHMPAKSKMIVLAHNGHVSRSPGAMGWYVSKKHADEMVSFCLTFHSGRYTAHTPDGISTNNVATPPCRGSVEWYLHELGEERLILDLRRASKESAESGWLTQSMDLRRIGITVEERQFWPAKLTEEYDGIIYIDSTHPTTLIKRK